MNGTWTDNCNEGYMQHFQYEPMHKFLVATPEALRLKINSHGRSCRWKPSKSEEELKAVQWDIASTSEFDGKSMEMEMMA